MMIFNDENYQKFNVLIEDEELIFYKSVKTGRWWIEIPFLPNVNNKLKKHTLLPCMHDDYVEASLVKYQKDGIKLIKRTVFSISFFNFKSYFHR